MKTETISKPILPAVLPHGWKKKVAESLGVHPNTVKNNLLLGSGEMYNRIIHTAAQMFGQSTKN